MNLDRLKDFLEECVKKKVEIPKNMYIGIDDYHKVIPPIYKDAVSCQYNHPINNGFLTILLFPSKES